MVKEFPSFNQATCPHLKADAKLVAQKTFQKDRKKQLDHVPLSMAKHNSVAIPEQSFGTKFDKNQPQSPDKKPPLSPARQQATAITRSASPPNEQQVKQLKTIMEEQEKLVNDLQMIVKGDRSPEEAVGN